MEEKCLVRVVDDNEELLQSLKFSLQLEGWDVDCFLSGKKFLEYGNFSLPGCIILDIQMPEISGIEIQEQLLDIQSMIPIIFISGHGNMDIAIHTFRQGAFDFIQKPLNADELISTIKRAIKKSLSAFNNQKKSSPEALIATLTDRQKAVFKCLADGLESHFIAERLGISPRTLQRHRQNVLRKLGVKEPCELRKFL